MKYIYILLIVLNFNTLSFAQHNSFNFHTDSLTIIKNFSCKPDTSKVYLECNIFFTGNYLKIESKNSNHFFEHYPLMYFGKRFLLGQDIFSYGYNKKEGNTIFITFYRQGSKLIVEDRDIKFIYDFY